MLVLAYRKVTRQLFIFSITDPAVWTVAVTEQTELTDL